jgi:3-deoxy-D-manno-octulosonate 8-phosphate phosphatase (KDO 8-P phosphatase)
MVEKTSTCQDRGPESGSELQQRALKIKLLLTDSDGVLTDSGVYYSANGEELRRFSVRDGMGAERLRKAGIETAIMTRENCLTVRKRAEKLKMRYLYVGVRDKLAHLPVVFSQTGFGLGQMAYIGDDVNDLEVIEAIGHEGLTGAPADAISQVKQAVHYVSCSRGGDGAFRDFAEWILALRGVHD